MTMHFSSYDLAPRPPPLPHSFEQVVSLSQSSGRVYWRKRGGGGAKSYCGEKAWSSINHSILSDLKVYYLWSQRVYSRDPQPPIPPLFECRQPKWNNLVECVCCRGGGGGGELRTNYLSAGCFLKRSAREQWLNFLLFLSKTILPPSNRGELFVLA